MKKVSLVLLVLLVLSISASFLFQPSVWADPPPEEPPLGVIKLPDFLSWTKAHPGISGINLLINNLVKLIFIIASVGLFIMFLYGGLRFILSQGDKAQTEAARNTITYAITGFAIVALSFALMRVIEAFFGISIIGPPPKCPFTTETWTYKSDCPVPPCTNWIPESPGSDFGVCSP